MSEKSESIAILGGTGDQGLGLALRFAKAGRRVVIGSRKVDRAETAARQVGDRVPGANVVGLGNADAAFVGFALAACLVGSGLQQLFIHNALEQKLGILMEFPGLLTDFFIFQYLGEPSGQLPNLKKGCPVDVLNQLFQGVMIQGPDSRKLRYGRAVALPFNPHPIFT